MRTAKLLPLLLAIALTLNGCAGIWNAMNRDKIHTDVTNLFLEFQRPITAVECRMLALSQEAVCTFPLSQQQVSLVRSAIGLQLTSQDADRAQLVRQIQTSKTGKEGCLQEPGFGLTNQLHVYASEQNPATLRLSKDTAFAYMVLYQNPVSSQGCIQLAYTSN